MTSTLIIKEIKDALHNFSFIYLILFSVIFIPLSLITSYSNYNKELSVYFENNLKYERNSEGNINLNFVAKGYRAPSIESIFTYGTTPQLPYRSITSNKGKLKIEKSSFFDDPLINLFGYLDFSFLMCFIISLLSIFFTYNLLNEEIEKGTMKLILVNPVPRHKIIVAKLIGNYIVFITPIIISFSIGLLLIIIADNNGTNFNDFFKTAIMVLLTSCFYIFLFFNLGVFISIYQRQVNTSVMTLLFLWLLICIIIPNLSPIISKIVYPVKSEEFFNNEIALVKKDFDNIIKEQEREVFNTLLTSNGIAPPNNLRKFVSNSKNSELMKKYDEEIGEACDEIFRKRDSKITHMQKDFEDKLNQQNKITKSLLRISPVSSFQFIVNEISKTGYSQTVHFKKQAQIFQDMVEAEIYNKYTTKRYLREGELVLIDKRIKGFNPKKTQPPKFRNTPSDADFGEIWFDITLLFLICTILFIFSYIKFLKKTIT